MIFDYAIAALASATEVCETNAPINEREGDRAQAALERSNADNYREAIRKLQG